MRQNINELQEIKELGFVDYAEVVVLFDNYPGYRCKTGWGLSILVVTNKATILFDTGASPGVLEYNVKVMNINMSNIDFIVISHEHGDHVRGLEYLSRVCKGVSVYVPEAMSFRVKEWIRSLGFSVVEVVKTMKITDGVAIIGELYGPPYEQALAVNVRDYGLVVIVGCSHPGVVNIVRKAVEELNVKPYMVIGGFHMAGCNIYEAEEVIDELISLGVKKIAPIHCSGDTIRNILKTKYPEYYQDAHVCKVVKLHWDC